jgi:hypothetical protein
VGVPLFHVVPALSARRSSGRVVGSAEVREKRVRMGRKVVSCIVG